MLLSQNNLVSTIRPNSVQVIVKEVENPPLNLAPQNQEMVRSNRLNAALLMCNKLCYNGIYKIIKFLKEN